MGKKIELQPIGGIDCYMASSLEDVEKNIVASLKHSLTEIEQLPEWKKSKGNTPFAIAGGGPSIEYTVHDLRHFRVIMAAGSSHDWLVDHGVIPNYTLLLDPDPATANYLKKPQVTCNYLVASCCHPKVFEALSGYPVTRWHAAGNEPQWFVKQWQEAGLVDNEGGKPIIGGGCTAGLRCLSMAMLFGYRNVHLFGLDSNLDMNSGAHHAYDFVDPENEFLGDVVPMRIGDPENGRLFFVAKYMLAQLWGLKDLLTTYGHNFDLTVHGDSVIYEFVRMRKIMAAQKATGEVFKRAIPDAA